MKKTFLITYIIWPFYLSKALAIQTQVNEVTDLFDKHIENKDSLLLDMKKQTDNAYGLIQSGQHHDSIEGMDGANGKADEFNSIKETDLGTSGRQKRLSKEYQFYDENELEPDYTKSGNLMHKSDVETIVSSTEKTMHRIGTDLMKKLIELGFNCKTIKGAIHKEPTYYIEIRKEEQKNIKYDQFFCEERKDQYSCNDSVSLNCIKKGIAFGSWQNRIMVTTFGVLPKHWWEEKPYYGLAVIYYRKMKINSAYVKEMATYIAGMIGARSEQVYVGNQNIVLIAAPNCGSINVDFSNCRLERAGYYADISPALVTFHYQYRDGYPICEQWAEDWTERCILK